MFSFFNLFKNGSQFIKPDSFSNDVLLNTADACGNIGLVLFLLPIPVDP